MPSLAQCRGCVWPEQAKHCGCGQHTCLSTASNRPHVAPTCCSSAAPGLCPAAATGALPSARGSSSSSSSASICSSMQGPRWTYRARDTCIVGQGQRGCGKSSWAACEKQCATSTPQETLHQAWAPMHAAARKGHAKLLQTASKAPPKGRRSSSTSSASAKHRAHGPTWQMPARQGREGWRAAANMARTRSCCSSTSRLSWPSRAEPAACGQTDYGAQVHGWEVTAAPGCLLLPPSQALKTKKSSRQAAPGHEPGPDLQRRAHQVQPMCRQVVVCTHRGCRQQRQNGMQSGRSESGQLMAAEQAWKGKRNA